VDAPVPLVCPREGRELRPEGGGLVCGEAHRYPLADGIPVLLLEDEPPTHMACSVSLEQAESEGDSLAASDTEIDPVVQEVVAATCGRLYRHLVGRLETYPIPELPLPSGEGALFLEVGCNWGRWCVAAARRGYRVVGIDPSLRAIACARRVASRLGVDVTYLVADARHLPFPDASFDVVFSYSVFQHFAKPEALASFDEIGRVLRPGGLAKLQLANLFGTRSLWNQLRERRFREPRRLFDVRYWSPAELREELTRRVGPTALEVDGFFTLNAQTAGLELLPRRYRLVVHASEVLRRASGRLAPLRYAADSLYAVSRRAR
jgi:SAM-dependent methyltransferase